MKQVIGIVGLGKLGLCMALNLERSGHSILGVDINKQYINSINSKTLRSPEPNVESYLNTSQNFIASTDYTTLINKDCKVIFIVVATPSLASGGYDHSQIDTVINHFISFGVSEEKKHIVINCTTMPSYCDSLAQKLKPYNYSLSYNPEFIAQGSIIKDQQYPDQVLIGSNNADALQNIEEIYRSMCKNEPSFCTMSLISAEITKLATNCFLTTKISFANSIGDLAQKVGAETDKILSAIGSDSRIGSKYLGYGFGFGGPCFPRDNRALSKYATDNEYHLLISEATDLTNSAHLEFQFNQWMKIPEKESIEFDHVSYKKGTDILEESQQLALAYKLAKAGRTVIIHENDEVITKLKSIHGELFTYARRG
ncbi:MAG: UDP-glucose/GDP-mannose dehydrogenase family protein [Flavobacteriales bacterium]|nr:UDP-glucose/GDP-mannose dehydrogenase family protein [Flavobacteriales bacterium]